jgi:hypothetical protein
MDADEKLHYAIRAGDLPRLRLLVQGGASIAETSVHHSALHHAAIYGKISIVEWLLADGGANISDVDDARGFTALLLTAFYHHLQQSSGFLSMEEQTSQIQLL